MRPKLTIRIGKTRQGVSRGGGGDRTGASSTEERSRHDEAGVINVLQVRKRRRQDQ